MKTFLFSISVLTLVILFLFIPTIITIVFGFSIGIAYWIVDGSLNFYFQFDMFLFRIQIIWIATCFLFFAVNFFMYFYNKRKKL